MLLTHSCLQEEQQTPNAAVPSPGLLSAPGLAPAPVAPGYFISSAYQPSQFPYVQPPSQCAPLSTSYRYPLLPGYPPPRPQAPSSAPQLSGLGGTAPSSFGKFRAEETTEDEEEDEENGLSMYGSEYTSEGLLQAPYYVQSDNHLVQDWMGQSGMGGGHVCVRLGMSACVFKFHNYQHCLDCLH